MLLPSQGNPDNVEDFFGLLSRMLSIAPAQLLGSEMMRPVMMCCVWGLGLDHREASVAVIQFIEKMWEYVSLQVVLLPTL